jgi:hypothetical protein
MHLAILHRPPLWRLPSTHIGTPQATTFRTCGRGKDWNCSPGTALSSRSHFRTSFEDTHCLGLDLAEAGAPGMLWREVDPGGLWIPLEYTMVEVREPSNHFWICEPETQWLRLGYFKREGVCLAILLCYPVLPVPSILGIL